MRKIKLLIIISLFQLGTIYASGIELDSINRDDRYVEVIKNRAQKIVDKLDLTCLNEAVSVRNIIANRYFELNDIYESRDSAIEKISEMSDRLSEEKIKESRELILNETDAKLYRTHFSYPAMLSLFLNNEQIDVVKDAMTYGVLSVTYTATLEMIPSLKEEEKNQILSWLQEAREYAIDAESSSKKHNVFGKYKGKINNYLSDRGYNLTQERLEWKKRLEKQKEKN